METIITTSLGHAQSWGDTGEHVRCARTGHILQVEGDGLTYQTPRQAEKAPAIARLTGTPVDEGWDTPRTKDGATLDTLWANYTQHGPQLNVMPDGSYGWGDYVDDPETGTRVWREWDLDEAYRSNGDNEQINQAHRAAEKAPHTPLLESMFVEPAKALGEFIVENGHMLGAFTVAGVKRVVVSLQRRALIDTIRRHRSGEYTASPRVHPSATTAALALSRLL